MTKQPRKHPQSVKKQQASGVGTMVPTGNNNQVATNLLDAVNG